MIEKRIAAPTTPKVCAVKDCTHCWVASYKGQWLCAMHRKRLRTYGDLGFVKLIRKHPPTCTFPGCEKPYLYKGYCSTHYGRMKRHGDPAKKLIRDFGTGSIIEGGYIELKGKSFRGGRALLHRVLMQEYLGRPIRQDEVVHHIDCDPSNNKLTNLEIMGRSEHTKMHNVLASLLSLNEKGFRHLNNHLKRHGLQVSIQKSFPL